MWIRYRQNSLLRLNMWRSAISIVRRKSGRETVRYCGAPLKYAFSEAGQEKSITVVELKEKGSVDLRTNPLKPLHDLRKIRGTYLEVTAKSFYENRDCEDYLQVTLTDEEDVPDGMGKTSDHLSQSDASRI